MITTRRNTFRSLKAFWWFCIRNPWKYFFDRLSLFFNCFQKLIKRFHCFKLIKIKVIFCERPPSWIFISDIIEKCPERNIHILDSFRLYVLSYHVTIKAIFYFLSHLFCWVFFKPSWSLFYKFLLCTFIWHKLI